MKIVVSAETEVHTTRNPDPTDSWDQGDTAGHVSNVFAFLDKSTGHYYGDSVSRDLNVTYGDTVYAVVADYESGSTFGRSGGHAQVLDVFTTEEDAAALLEAAQANPKTDAYQEKYSFEHNGVTYHRAWVGYFESLNSLDVWDVVVRQNPNDPIKRGPGRYSLKRGN
jgi:hypothetical protein